VNDDFTRCVASIEPDGGGSLVTLSCGHVLWCAIAPAEIGTLKTVYCAMCLCNYLDSRRPADVHAN